MLKNNNRKRKVKLLQVTALHLRAYLKDLTSLLNVHLKSAPGGEISGPVEPFLDAIRVKVIRLNLKLLPGFVHVIRVTGRGGVEEVELHVCRMFLLL